MRNESLWLTASYGLTAFVGVAFWAVSARTEPAEQLGLATAIVSAFTAAAVVGATGIANAFLAMIPIAGPARGRLLTHGYLLLTGSCLVTGSVAGVIAAFTVPAIGSPWQTALTIMATSVMWGVFVVQDSVLIAFGKARWLLAENMPVSILKVGMLPVFAAAFGIRSHPVVLATIAPALLAVVVISGVVVPRLARGDYDLPLSAADPDGSTARDWMAQHRGEFRLFALRDGAASAMNLGLFLFMPFLVTATAGAVQGAVFTLSLQISNAMDLFTAGVGVTLTTTVATDHAAGPAAARIMWKRLARIVSGVAVLVIAGSPVLLLIFGETYLKHDGWQVVVILAVASVMRTTFEVWTALMRALRRVTVLLLCSSVLSSLMLFAVVLGAHLDGAVGAAAGVALVTVLSSAVGALGLLGRIGTEPRSLRAVGDGAGRGPRDVWPWEGYEPASLDGIREQPTFFGPPDLPLFGWLTLPETGMASVGVLICPPVGEEARSSHRTFRRLGVELARAGIAVLRLDYAGTGDSAGGQDDPGRVAAWQESIRAGARELRSMGIADVAMVGMRIGATLAATVAAEGEFGSVVLWDPCRNGRSFLREGHALHALSEHTEDPVVRDGDVHTPGFRYDADTARDLEALSLAGLPEGKWCRRMLVLTRTARPPAGAAFSAPHVEVGVADEQQQLVGAEPSLARVPHATIARIVAWLAAGADPERQAAFTVEPRLEAVLEDPRSGTRVRERIAELGPNRLFAVLTEPLDPPRDAPWLLLPNVLTEPHIGPGRTLVDFARAWAAMGVRSARYDQSGLGDSPTRPGQPEERVFDPHWLQDFADVYDALQTGPAPVATYGHCSASYTAFEGALRRPLDALYAISPRISLPQFAFGEAGYSPERLAGRRFVRPVARVFHRDTMAAWGLWRLYRQLAPWHAPMAVAVRLTRAGTDLRIIANRKDAEEFREVLWWTVVRRRATVGNPRYRLRLDDGVDHAMLTQLSQRLAFDDATAYWCERYGLVDPGPRSEPGVAALPAGVEVGVLA